MTTNCAAAFLPKMAQQEICSYTEGIMEWVHIHLEPAPSPRATAPPPPGANQGAQSSDTDSVLSVFVYFHAFLSNTQFFNLEAYAKDCKHDKDFIPDLLTNTGTSTGYFTICCVAIQQISILQMRAANSANMTVQSSIDRQE